MGTRTTDRPSAAGGQTWFCNQLPEAELIIRKNPGPNRAFEQAAPQREERVPENFAIVCDGIVYLSDAPTLDRTFSPSLDMKIVSCMHTFPLRIGKVEG